MPESGILGMEQRVDSSLYLDEKGAGIHPFLGSSDKSGPKTGGFQSLKKRNVIPMIEKLLPKVLLQVKFVSVHIPSRIPNCVHCSGNLAG